jgi:predicted Zn-dependent protease
VSVLQDPAPNVFALPGDGLGIYTGLFEVARTPGQLAAAIAHAMAHVIADHPNFRLATGLPAASGAEIIQAIASTETERSTVAGKALALLGIGGGFGPLIPYARADENEADRIGLDLMSIAGFDPHEAIDLWSSFERVDREQTGHILFLEEHPSRETRLANLDQRMAHAESLHDRALAAGKNPACKLDLPVASR